MTIHALFVAILAGSLLAPLKTPTETAGPKPTTQLSPPQAAPRFEVRDVNGQPVKLSDLKGHKVLLTFYRNAGCPICNRRFHELNGQAEWFRSKGVRVLAVYESTPERIREYLDGQTPYTQLIADPEQVLYGQYGVERSMGKMMNGLFHGAMRKMKEGRKQFIHPIKQDGNANRIGADFLIDEQGNLIAAHYGRYVGDHLPIGELKALLE